MRFATERRLLGALLIIETLALVRYVDPMWIVVGAFLTIPVGLTMIMFPMGDGCPPGAGMQ